MFLMQNGLRAWVLQRVTAVILAIYILYLVGFVWSRPQLSYVDWLVLFNNPGMQVISLIVLLSLLFHAWVGMWTVITDYIKTTFLRVLAQLIVLIVLIGLMVWGIQIIWVI